MKKLSKGLSAHQQKLFDAFTKKNLDIDIDILFGRLYKLDVALSPRQMQQRLAPTIKAINEKLRTAKGTYLLIEPGNLKRTYRLSTIRG